MYVCYYFEQEAEKETKVAFWIAAWQNLDKEKDDEAYILIFNGLF